MTRKRFLQLFALALGGLAMPVSASAPKMKRAPAFFVGHGTHDINSIFRRYMTIFIRHYIIQIIESKAKLLIFSVFFLKIDIYFEKLFRRFTTQY